MVAKRLPISREDAFWSTSVCNALVGHRPISNNIGSVPTGPSELAAVIRDEGFQPIRLDRDLHTGDVRQTVQQLVQECDAVVADITKLSANVMYEVGLAHAQGKKPPPLLIWRTDPELIEASLPFYLRPYRIASSKDQGGTLGALRDYLEAIRSGSSSSI